VQQAERIHAKGAKLGILDIEEGQRNNFRNPDDSGELTTAQAIQAVSLVLMFLALFPCLNAVAIRKGARPFSLNVT
jgi:hypothetical protein